jgi:hypothetical protein
MYGGVTTAEFPIRNFWTGYNILAPTLDSTKGGMRIVSQTANIKFTYSPMYNVPHPGGYYIKSNWDINYGGLPKNELIINEKSYLNSWYFSSVPYDIVGDAI